MRINFNLAQTQAYSGSSPVLPAGDYTVEIVSESDQQIKSGGNALVFEYQVKEGQFRGNRLRDWINIGSSNQAAREIAQRRLKAIGESVGLEQFNDTRELFNRPFLVNVGMDEYQGRQRNSIDGYRPLANSTPAPIAAQPAPANPGESVPYWS